MKRKKLTTNKVWGWLVDWFLLSVIISIPLNFLISASFINEVMRDYYYSKGYGGTIGSMIVGDIFKSAPS